MVEDIVLGGGQIGKAIAAIVKTDIIYDKSEKICTYQVGTKCEVLHVCIPFEGYKYFSNTINFMLKMTNAKYVMIHSTVPVGTTASLQYEFTSTFIYSPVLGQHPKLEEDIRSYVKLYSTYQDYVNVDTIMYLRFKTVMHISKPETLELSKLVETTYLGLLVEFTKLVDEIAHDDKDVWECSRIADSRHHNRPIMYNNHQEIGGHCVIPNLKLFPTKIEGGYNEKYPVLDQLISILLHSAKEKISTSAEGSNKKNEGMNLRKYEHHTGWRKWCG